MLSYGQMGSGRNRLMCTVVLIPVILLLSQSTWAHGLAGRDAAFVAGSSGTHIIPFIYLGAKHMVTGYDHLLFILGVIFFLHRLSHVALYVTMFSLGHSITLLAGVLGHIRVDPYLIDALIGLSVVYKAIDNLDGFTTLFGFGIHPKTAVLVFGLFHGLGLATKLQSLHLSPDGLLPNMIAFNVGVEIGQLLALTVLVGLMALWRRQVDFQRQALLANAMILTAGLVLIGYQLTGYLVETGT
jgi:hypothetical protein